MTCFQIKDENISLHVHTGWTLTAQTCFYLANTVNVPFLCSQLLKAFVHHLTVHIDVGSIFTLVIIVVGEDRSLVSADDNAVCIHVLVDDKKIRIFNGILSC